MKMPEKTQETIDPDGFMHSGDVVKVRSISSYIVCFGIVIVFFLYDYVIPSIDVVISWHVFSVYPSLNRLTIVFKMVLKILVSLALLEGSRNSSSRPEERMLLLFSLKMQ